MTPYNSNKWDEWMRAALTGDQNAYRLLLTDLRPWLEAYFRKRIQPAMVEDLVQETLLALHDKRQTFDPAQSFGPWISAIARHKWIDTMRRMGRVEEKEWLESDHAIEEVAYDGHAKDVEKLLGTIPPEQARVIEMVKLKEMSIKEVSKATGHSVSSVKVMVHRGIKAMQAAIKGERV